MRRLHVPRRLLIPIAVVSVAAIASAVYLAQAGAAPPAPVPMSSPSAFDGRSLRSLATNEPDARVVGEVSYGRLTRELYQVREPDGRWSGVGEYTSGAPITRDFLEAKSRLDAVLGDDAELRMITGDLYSAVVGWSGQHEAIVFLGFKGGHAETSAEIARQERIGAAVVSYQVYEGQQALKLAEDVFTQ